MRAGNLLSSNEKIVGIDEYNIPYVISKTELGFLLSNYGCGR
jgi:hypothetical protein